MISDQAIMMDSLVLYSYRRCPFAIRVRMVLEEKKLAYRLIEENLSSLSAELLSLHPEGRVPLLVHELSEGRQVIYQSSIITEYLDEAFPSIPLMPSEPRARAQVRLWTYWCDQIFKPDLDLYKYELSQLSEEDRKSLIERIQTYLALWDFALQSGEFLLGAQLTLADIHLFPFARQFMACKPSFPQVESYANLNAWLNRIVGRASFAVVMKKS